MQTNPVGNVMNTATSAPSALIELPDSTGATPVCLVCAQKSLIIRGIGDVNTGQIAPAGKVAPRI